MLRNIFGIVEAVGQYSCVAKRVCMRLCIGLEDYPVVRHAEQYQTASDSKVRSAKEKIYFINSRKKQGRISVQRRSIFLWDDRAWLIS